jgi:hypothetical protein
MIDGHPSASFNGFEGLEISPNCKETRRFSSVAYDPADCLSGSISRKTVPLLPIR